MIFQCCGMFSAGGVGRNLEFLNFFEKLCAVLLTITRFRSEIYQVVTILEQLLLGNFDHGFDRSDALAQIFFRESGHRHGTTVVFIVLSITSIFARPITMGPLGR